MIGFWSLKWGPIRIFNSIARKGAWKVLFYKVCTSAASDHKSRTPCLKMGALVYTVPRLAVDRILILWSLHELHHCCKQTAQFSVLAHARCWERTNPMHSKLPFNRVYLFAWSHLKFLICVCPKSRVFVIKCDTDIKTTQISKCLRSTHKVLHYQKCPKDHVKGIKLLAHSNLCYVFCFHSVIGIDKLY